MFHGTAMDFRRPIEATAVFLRHVVFVGGTVKMRLTRRRTKSVTDSLDAGAYATPAETPARPWLGRSIRGRWKGPSASQMTGAISAYCGKAGVVDG
ncbi:hypothetical protein CBM2605_P380026 [Cupriavidus neocaledonicus]|nr:hypothetical protein CBM2595_P390025 [Cupriavidus taiwanensis]SOZ40705.1 hypothetical protein CBM2605_P380026 [Cupriavidus neocaledonicus]